MTWGSNPTHKELRESSVNVRQQFLENMANATTANREYVLMSALKAYSPGDSVYYKDKLVRTKYPNGDEVYSYMGDPIIRFVATQYGWKQTSGLSEQKPESMTFTATQEYEILFDIEDGTADIEEVP